MFFVCAALPVHVCANYALYRQEGDGVSPTAIREILVLREMNHANIVRLDSVHLNHADPSLSLAFDYAEHDLYEMVRHHR
jgi:cyclin-dependent kinase 8/11